MKFSPFRRSHGAADLHFQIPYPRQILPHTAGVIRDVTIIQFKFKDGFIKRYGHRNL